MGICSSPLQVLLGPSLPPLNSIAATAQLEATAAGDRRCDLNKVLDSIVLRRSAGFEDDERYSADPSAGLPERV